MVPATIAAKPPASHSLIVQAIALVSANGLDALQTMSGLGINVVRTWGFCNGCGDNRSIQTSVTLVPFPSKAMRALVAQELVPTVPSESLTQLLPAVPECTRSHR